MIEYKNKKVTPKVYAKHQVSDYLMELFNSPEVYMLQGFQTDSLFSGFNQYVAPVRMQTSSFVKKTIGNDKLIQYTFEVEKSKTLRTQSI